MFSINSKSKQLHVNYLHSYNIVLVGHVEQFNRNQIHSDNFIMILKIDDHSVGPILLGMAAIYSNTVCNYGWMPMMMIALKVSLSSL